MNTAFATINMPPILMAPFALLLAVIALSPLFAPWWSRHYPKVVAALSAAVIAYYIFALGAWGRMSGTGRDYFSFIVLLGALYIVAGGIHITVKGIATPGRNAGFLLLGALAANLLGTTGASILLIHPWLRLNRSRFAAHHLVFFIFIVSNVGGCLTPISDPPLFIGYLLGVPFWWVAQHGWEIWATGLGTLLVLFYCVDSYQFRTRSTSAPIEPKTSSNDWRFEGGMNLVFLAGVLGAVFVKEPPFVREAIMIAAAVASYYLTPKSVHDSNQFSLGPMKEIAILFLGIFATMMPALDWLQANASTFHSPSPGLFYAGSGGLSSILDSAPTYYCFVQAAYGKFVHPEAVAVVAQLVHTHGAGLAALINPDASEIRGAFAALQKFHPNEIATGSVTTDQIQMAFLLGNPTLSASLLAISIGAVFFGAATYLGNGPNLMVKAIVEHQNIRVPGFMAYIFKYALPLLGPMLLLVWLLFFR